MAQTFGVALAAGAMLMTAGPALAQERAVRVSYEALKDGDVAKAERTLTAERRIYPDRPEVLLNLAAVHARKGQATEAVALYRSVLAQDDVLMDLPGDRIASAHSLAKRGIDRLRPTVATR